MKSSRITLSQIPELPYDFVSPCSYSPRKAHARLQEKEGNGTTLCPHTQQNRSFVSPLGVCRALADEHGHSTGATRGRVEHVVSGQSMHFASLEELLAFIDQVLAHVRAPPRRRLRAK